MFGQLEPLGRTQIAARGTPVVPPEKPAPRVFVAGTMDDETGYGVHTSSFLAALRRTAPFEVRAIDLGRGAAYGGLDAPNADDVIVFIGSPEAVGLFEASPARKVCFTVWESDRLPDTWRRPLSMVDEVWTASPWCARIMRHEGINPRKLHVVPEGVDGQVFRPDGEGLALIDGIDGFKFLHVGKAEPRKGTFELLQAFDRAFGADEPVYLVLACHNRFIAGFDTVRFIENLCLRRRRRIVPVQPLPERRDVAALYRSCDAFLAPSRAEGWGLPALEAMASGLPTALTHYSGHKAFANEANSIPLPFTMGTLDSGSLPQFPRRDEDYGRWAEPDVDGMAEVMRQIFQEREALRRWARRHAATVRRTWSWERAAAAACARLSLLCARERLEVP